MRPKHGKVGLGGGAERIQCVEHAEAVLGNEGSAVLAHAADAFGYPHGVTAEKLVIFGCAQMPRNAKLHYKVVYKLLRLTLGQLIVFQVTLNENIEKSADPSERHCRAVLLLYCGKIGKISPLNGFARIACGRAYIKAVAFRHFFNIGKRRYLI